LFYGILNAKRQETFKLKERENQPTVDKNAMRTKEKKEQTPKGGTPSPVQKETFFTYDERVLRREVIFAIAFYIFILLWALCLKFCNAEMLAQNYKNLSELNLRERFLWDIVPFYTRQNHTVQRLEFVANSIVFAPFGVLLNYLFKKRCIIRDFALCVGFSLAIEVFQLFTLLGGFATADLIMNSLGYFVGLAIYYLIFKKRTVKTCIWTCRVANAIFLPLFIWALVTTLQNGELILSILTKQL
jgi:glycopeptide antibiotics resistance protein